VRQTRLALGAIKGPLARTVVGGPLPGRGLLVVGFGRVLTIPLDARAYAVKRYFPAQRGAVAAVRDLGGAARRGVGAGDGWGSVPRKAILAACRSSSQRCTHCDVRAQTAFAPRAHAPERVRCGQWWRTQIVLLAA
jgi:hypothetical protein